MTRLLISLAGRTLWMRNYLCVHWLTDWLDCPLSSQGSILSAMADVCFALKLKRYFRLLQTLMYSLLYKNNFQIFWQKTCSHAWNPFEQRFCFIHLFVSQNNKHDGAKKINFNAEYSVQFSVSTILNKQKNILAKFNYFKSACQLKYKAWGVRSNYNTFIFAHLFKTRIYRHWLWLL